MVGDTLTGYFSVVDHFFNTATIALVPITVGGIAVYEPGIALFSDPAMTLPLPNPVVFNGTNTTGVSGYFRLETNDMTPCGYTIELTATDRALADSHCWNHWNQIGVGFCLRAK